MLAILTHSAACITVPDDAFDNPCDPRNSGACGCGDGELCIDAAAHSALDTQPPRRVTVDSTLVPHRPDTRADLPPDVGRAQPRVPDGGCPDYYDGHIICSAIIDGLCAYEYYVNSDESVDCYALCSAVNLTCVRRWYAEASAHCAPTVEVTCDEHGSNMICGCGWIP